MRSSLVIGSTDGNFTAKASVPSSVIGGRASFLEKALKKQGLIESQQQHNKKNLITSYTPGPGAIRVSKLSSKPQRKVKNAN